MANVVDLGAGSGILIERILASFPDVYGYRIDYSDDFLRVDERNRLPLRAGDQKPVEGQGVEGQGSGSCKQTLHMIECSSTIHGKSKERLHG